MALFVDLDGEDVEPPIDVAQAATALRALPEDMDHAAADEAAGVAARDTHLAGKDAEGAVEEARDGPPRQYVRNAVTEAFGCYP